jgi:hypothetical protein
MASSDAHYERVRARASDVVVGVPSGPPLPKPLADALQALRDTGGGAGVLEASYALLHLAHDDATHSAAWVTDARREYLRALAQAVEDHERAERGNA